MIKKRLLSFLGAAAIAAALTFAVVSLSPSNGFTSGTMQEGLCYEATGVAPDAIVASVDGNGASADLIAYWTGYNVSYLDSYMQYYTGAAFDWDYTFEDGTSITDYVKSNVLMAVKQHLVLENLAEEYGATLTAEQKAAIEASDQAYIDQYGSEEAFEAELNKLGMRRETYDLINFIMIRFNDRSAADDDLIRLLQTSSSQKLKRLQESGIRVTDEMRNEVNTMCNYGDMIENQGISTGIKQSARAIALKMLKNEESLEKIHEYTEFPIDELLKLAADHGINVKTFA